MLTDEQEARATELAMNAWTAEPSMPIGDVVRDILTSVLKVKIGNVEPEQLPRDSQLAYFRVCAIAARARIAWLDDGGDQQLRELIAVLREILGSSASYHARRGGSERAVSERATGSP